MIKVALIGSGNVAKHLFEVFSMNETIEVVQVISRNEAALKNFGESVNTTVNFSRIAEADIYIIAVSDDAIHAISQLLRYKKKLIIHVSGNTSIQILSDHKRNGVFYPLQTFSKKRKIDFSDVPICFEANNEADSILLEKLAKSISSKVYNVTSEQRKALHLAAVFVNNFTNHLNHIASRICNENQLPFEILRPLIRETVDKLELLSPYEAQTGPARRGDKKTLEDHVGQLKNSTHKEIYAVLSKSIQKTYGKKL